MFAPYRDACRICRPHELCIPCWMQAPIVHVTSEALLPSIADGGIERSWRKANSARLGFERGCGATCHADACESGHAQDTDLRKGQGVGDSHRQPLDFLGSPTWARTRDLRINSPALYRLSYRGTEP